MGHARSNLYIVVQMNPDHLKKMYMDLVYWSVSAYQERNTNQFLGIIRQMAYGHLSIIDARIQLNYLKQLYYLQ